MLRLQQATYPALSERDQDRPLPDGPVPGMAQSGVCGECRCQPHSVERDIHEMLRKLPNARFSRLEVHCMENAVCVTGVMTVSDDDSCPQIDRVICDTAGIMTVVNRLMVRTSLEELASPSDFAAQGIPHEEDSTISHF